MPGELAVRTGHVTVAVTVPDEVNDQTLDELGARVGPALPGGWRADRAPAEPTSRPALRVEVLAAERPGVTRAGEHVRVGLPTHALNGVTLAYVIYTCAERARQRAGMATAHAAAVTSPYGQAVVVLGDKGAGKTTTVLALLAAGYQLLGDDLIVLSHHGADGRDGLWVLPGNHRIAVRRTGALLGYEAKTRLDLDAAALAGAPASLVVRVGVHPAARPAVAACTPLSVVERLRLAENLARYINGAATPLDLHPRVWAPVYPLDSPACTATRAVLIDQLAKAGLRYLHAPTAEQAADMISQLLRAVGQR